VVAEKRPAEAAEPFDLYRRLKGKCPICNKDEKKKRPPYGLVGRLHGVSGDHRTMLVAPTKKTVVSVGSVAGMSTTLLSVGYVIWCLRGGSLVATLLTTLPLWKWLDPLPVLDHYDEEGKRRQGQADEDEERLRSMMEG